MHSVKVLFGLEFQGASFIDIPSEDLYSAFFVSKEVLKVVGFLHLVSKLIYDLAWLIRTSLLAHLDKIGVLATDQGVQSLVLKLHVVQLLLYLLHPGGHLLVNGRLRSRELGRVGTVEHRGRGTTC